MCFIFIRLLSTREIRLYFMHRIRFRIHPYPGPEKFFNELQDVAVSDLGRDTLHNQFVRDVIKESFDIRIRHELMTVVGIF